MSNQFIFIISVSPSAEAMLAPYPKLIKALPSMCQHLIAQGGYMISRIGGVLELAFVWDAGRSTMHVMSKKEGIEFFPFLAELDAKKEYEAELVRVVPTTITPMGSSGEN